MSVMEEKVLGGGRPVYGRRTHGIDLQNVLPRLLDRTYLGIDYWWYDKHEIDVVGLGEAEPLVAGWFKHTSEQMTIGELEGLQ